jgi:hypothetical protein
MVSKGFEDRSPAFSRAKESEYQTVNAYNHEDFWDCFVGMVCAIFSRNSELLHAFKRFKIFSQKLKMALWRSLLERF